MIQSRFTGSTAIAFEFQRTKGDLPNHPALFVSHVTIDFTTAPTTAGKVQVFFSDVEGESLIWEGTPQGKTFMSCTPKLHIPVPKNAKLILRYANANSVEVTARFLWRV